MDELEFQLKEQPGKLAIESPIFGEGVDGEVDARWRINPIDEHRLILMSPDAGAGMSGDKDGFGHVPVSVFHSFLLNLLDSRWSGVLSVDTGFGAKRLFFAGGDLVFAASNIIDDRLGEVMYRHSMITLDELTTAAAQVNKDLKFGQVLLKSGVFSHVNLWEALKQQVREILRSTFLVDTVYYQMEQGDSLAPTAIVYEGGSRVLVDEAYAYGCQVREFLSRLTAESRMVIRDNESILKAYKPGSFIGDMSALIQDKSEVQELLNNSKLMDINTIAAIYLLVSRGFGDIEPLSPPERKTGDPALKAKIDAYQYVLQTVLRRFETDEETFPMRELEVFVSTLNAEDFVSIYLMDNGGLNPDCISGMLSQCQNHPNRVRHFELRIESMIQFLLQVTGDKLSWDVADSIRTEYYSLMA